MWSTKLQSVTKLLKPLFRSKYFLPALGAIAALHLLVVVGGIIGFIFLATLFFSLKNSVAEVGRVYTNSGEIDLAPLPISQSLWVSDTLLRWKKWDLFEKSSALLLLTKQLQTSDQRLLLLFQGPEELRPTGGFMGAYGIATFSEGKLTELVFEDIYDAAGQMKTRFEPPPGVAEYTSGGEGWKLPDANWDPHFPNSVETICAMMRDAGKGEFTGVIAVNTTMLKNLLEITGPVNLPEYQTELSVDTVDQLLSAHREEFFAGSRAKVTMLQQSFTKMLYTLARLSSKQQASIGQLLLTSIKNKDVQIWHHDAVLQGRLTKAGAAGTVPNSSYIAPVEASVGINKINPMITREVTNHRQGDTLVLTIKWTNTAEKGVTTSEPVNPDRKPFVGPAPESDHNAYVNYFRVLTSGDIHLELGSASELIIVEPQQTITREYTFRIPPNILVEIWQQSGIYN